MPLFRYDGVVLLNAPTYQALGGVNAYVCTQPSNANQLNPAATPIPPAPLATLYADSFGTTLVNPVVTDSNGHYFFYANPATYDIVVNDPFGRLSSTFVYLDQSVGVASGGGGLAFQTNGTPNANQALLNIATGTGISAVNTGGTVTLTNTGFTPVAVAPHFVYIGPTSGSGLPTFRALVLSDLPGAGTIGGSIAANQIAVGAGSNTIGGSSALTYGAGFLELASTAGMDITDTSSTGVTISVSGSSTGKVFLRSDALSQGIQLENDSPTGGITLLDESTTSGGGIFLNNTGGGGIFLEGSGTGSSIGLANSGSGGTGIEDSGSGGISIRAGQGGQAHAFLLLESDGTGSGSGVQIKDTGGTNGITLNANNFGSPVPVANGVVVYGSSVTIADSTPSTAPGTEFAAPSLLLQGTYWTGSASAADTFSLDVTMLGDAMPSNASATLTLNHTGSNIAYFTMGPQIFRFTSAGENVLGTVSGEDFVVSGEQSNGTVFTLTSVANASGSLTTYAGTFAVIFPTAGQYVTIAGFTNSANNGRFLVSGTATSTHVTVYNSSGTAETHAATATIDLPYYSGGVFAAYGFGAGSSFHLLGNTYTTAANYDSEPSCVPLVIGMGGNATDAGYARVVNDPTTGNHGLEVGAITDGTGAAPSFLQLGHFGGQSCAQFNVPLVVGNENLTTDTNLTGGVRITPIATNSDANFALLPTGSSTTSNIEWRNSSDSLNVGVANAKLIGTTWYFESLAIGTGNLPVNMDTTALFLQIQQHTPASSSAAGVAGTITYDSSFIYQCIATNTWKRTAISTW